MNVTVIKVLRREIFADIHTITQNTHINTDVRNSEILKQKDNIQTPAQFNEID